MDSSNCAPRVAIILVNWNGGPYTCKCLSLLKELTYSNYDIIVVDNASSDDSLNQIRSAFPEITLLENEYNKGFSGGCNRGIRYALKHDAEYIWLLNNDTEPHAQALSALVDYAEANPAVGGVSSVIYYMHEPRRISAWGGGWVNVWMGHAGHFTKPVPAEALHYLTAASLLLRREAVEQVGLLDEQYFMYWEDTDLCFRMRQQGWKLRVAPASQVWHHVSVTIGHDQIVIDTIFISSFVKFIKRHAPWPFLPLMIGIGLRLAKRLILRDWKRVQAVWHASRHPLTPRDLDMLVQESRRQSE